MRWEYCENCYIDGHCENQDREYECETYGKRMKDKCERLQKQLEQMRREHKEHYIVMDELRTCLFNCRNYFVSNNIDFFVNQIDKILKI